MRTVAQAIKDASRESVLPPSVFSCFKTDVFPSKGTKKKGAWRHNLTTDTATGYTNRRDWQAKAMGMGPAFAFATAVAFPAATISATATSLTNSAATFPTAGQGLAGQIVVAIGLTSANIVYGVITSNTGTAPTIDQWYAPGSASGAAGTTPTTNGGSSSTGIGYVILPGQNAAAWLCISASVFTPSSADNALSSQGAELTSSTGFARAVAAYAHTAAATTYTLIHLWTASGAGSVVNNEGVAGAATLLATPNWGGPFPFESAEPSPPTLVSGDTLQNTVTVTIN